MKLELKEYQVGAHEELLKEIDNAMRGIGKRRTKFSPFLSHRRRVQEKQSS